MKRRVTFELDNCYKCPHHKYNPHTRIRRCGNWIDDLGNGRIIEKLEEDDFPKWCQLEMVLECGDFL